MEEENRLTLVVSGFRMSAYEEIRNKLRKKDKNGFSLWKKVAAGMMAGGKHFKCFNLLVMIIIQGIGQLMASPTDLIKTQIQMEGRRRLVGESPRVHGMVDAFQ